MTKIFLGRRQVDRSCTIGFSQHTKADNADDIFWGANDGHLCTVAPTGAGKTRAVLVPALLSCRRPAIILDPKAEIYAMTAPAREAQGFRTVLVSLDDQAQVLGGFNPMDLVRLGSMRGDDALSLSQLIVGLPQGTDPFWDRAASQVISGFIELVAGHFPQPLRNLATVRRLIFDDPTTMAKAIALALHPELSTPLIRAAANLLKVAPDRTRSSILATVDAHLSPLASPSAIRSMRSSFISVADIISGEPVTMYITVPPSKLNSHRTILRLWLGSLLMALMRRAPGLYLNSTLIMIDETAQLGALPELETAITLMRGFGLQVWTFWQELDQIRATYPRSWRTIVNNSGVLQCFGIRNAQAALEIETLLGVHADLTKIGPTCQALKLGAAAPIIAQLPAPMLTASAESTPSKTLGNDYGR